MGVSRIWYNPHRSPIDLVILTQFSLDTARNGQKKGRFSAKPAGVKALFRPGRRCQVETPRHFPGNRDIFRSRLVSEKQPLCGLDILNRDDVRSSGVGADRMNDIETAATDPELRQEVISQKIRDLRPRHARHPPPANPRQIEVLRAASKQMDFMVFRQTFSDFIDGPSTPVPPIAVDHRERDSQTSWHTSEEPRYLTRKNHALSKATCTLRVISYRRSRSFPAFTLVPGGQEVASAIWLSTISLSSGWILANIAGESARPKAIHITVNSMKKLLVQLKTSAATKKVRAKPK